LPEQMWCTGIPPEVCPGLHELSVSLHPCLALYFLDAGKVFTSVHGVVDTLIIHPCL